MGIYEAGECCTSGKMRLYNIAACRKKETDRASLKKCGTSRRRLSACLTNNLILYQGNR